MRIKRFHNGQSTENVASQPVRPARIRRIANNSVSNARSSVKNVKTQVTRSSKKHIHTIAPIGVAFVFLFVVIFGQNSQQQLQDEPTARLGGLGGVSLVDEVSSAKIAADIANGANLIVAENVQNLADSQQAQVQFAVTEDAYITKPQIVTTEAKTKNDIVQYKVQRGDTISSIAKKFNITSDTIRWENDIVGNSVSVGRTLTILPVSGIRYKVKDGDTAQSIAQRYSASAPYIIAFNDAEISGLKPGNTIIIPQGEKPQVQQTYFSSGYGFAFGSQPLYGGNGYGYGYCTWHAANRRQQVGMPIPRNLGNAVTWATLAAAAGLGVGENPKQYAVLWHKNTYIAGGLGHVGFVEEINPDGSILVSDMNYPYWNAVTYRTISPSEFNQYLFIY